ncbi:response regulator [Candidatus Falkowbacteria bacterium]|nr:response regulator [Candidatus Falkowbacteria bacterium]
MKRSKKVIVLADDDKWLVDLYGEKLRLEGYEVHTAHNGKDGFDLVLENMPDLVLSDVVMAGGDGFYLLKKIKSNPETMHVPVISLTNLSNEQDKKALFDIGTADYLVKADFTPTQVVDRISKILEREIARKAKAGVTLVKKTKIAAKV